MSEVINLENVKNAVEESATNVVRIRSEMKTFLQDQFNSLIVDAGPAADIILGPTSAILGAAETIVTLERQRNNLEQSLSDGVDPLLLEEQINARGISIIKASPASGYARIVIPTTVNFDTVTLNQNSRFATFEGLAYKPTTNVTFSKTSQPGMTTLTQTTSGYVGDFAIESVETGSAYNLPVGKMLVPTTSILTGASFYTITEVSGGRDDETSAEVLARLPSTNVTKNLFTEAGIKALVADVTDDVQVSVIGSGNVGMTRGMSPIGTYLPGHVDVRIKPNQPLGSLITQVKATLVQDDAGVGVWQFTSEIGEPYAPVFVQRVWKDGLIPADGAEYTITERSNAIDTTSDLLDNADIRDIPQAAYTKAGLVTCKFRDTDTPLGGLTVGVSTKFYSALIRYIPDISEIQTYLDTFATTSGDCVVRGVTPVRVLVNATITDNSTVTVTNSEIQTAIANAINAAPINNKLSSGRVFSSNLPSGIAIVSADLSGLAHRQNGTIFSLPTSQTLDTGVDAENGLTEGTVGFFCDADDVTITTL